MKYSRLLSSLSVIVVVGALVWGGAWFWSVGSVAAEKLPAIRVQVKTGTVEHRSAGASEFQTVSDIREIQPGDTVKTGAASEAEILWGDLGVSRVAENSEVVIDDAPRDVSGEGAVIRLKVNAGRVWNRMLKLLDLESSMQVQTSDVVATVRGTSYGIIKQPNCTEAAVTESVVGISSGGSDDEVLLADNEWGSFGANNCRAPVRKLTPADTWPAEERLKDERFDRDYLAGLRQRFETRAEKIKNTPAWVVDASEKLHLALATGEAKESLALDYARRHLAQAVVQPEERKTSTIKSRLELAGAKSILLRGELHATASLFNRTKFGPDAVIDFRGVRDILASQDEPQRVYLNLVRVDEGIDDYLFGAIEEGKKIEVATALINRLEEAESEITEKQLDPRLVKKAQAVRERLADAFGISPEGSDPSTDSSNKTEIRIDEPTLNRPVLKPAPKPAPAPTTAPTSRIYLRLQLLASPSTVAVGQPVKLSLYGVKADGQAEDITSQAIFVLANPSSGSLTSSIFTPSVEGTASINAAYKDAQGTRTASASVTVKNQQIQGVQLKSIAYQTTSPTTLACGGTVPFKIMGTYTDGKTKDVTIQSKFSVSDSKLLFAEQGKIMTFCPSTAEATGTVTASVTENGITKTAVISITVLRDPNSGSGGYRYRYP